MNIQEIQADKLSLINWISQLQDISLINKLKNIQEDNFEIPQWQQDIVLERMKTAKPEDYIPWEEAKKLLRK
ncbi:MAG: hypothetical protein KAT68_11695 [Bacteroidales bacterium]|nr:hypothetical protein [Bacteroidales bacterium]